MCRRSVIALVMVSFRATGCNSAAPSPADGAADVARCDGGCSSPMTVEAPFIDRFCALTEPCCVAVGWHPRADVVRCRDDMRRHGVSSDPELQAACLADLKALAGKEACLPLVSDYSAPCARLFNEPSGPIPSGGAGCDTNADCQGVPGTLTVCSLGAGGLTGTACLQMTVGQEGSGPCVGETDRDGITFTVPFSSHGEPPVLIGTLCRYADGLYCNFSYDGTPPLCLPLIPDGAPCPYSRICASGACEDPSGSIITNGTCAVRVSAGGTCGPDRARCPAGTYCDGTRTCVPTLPPGARCTDGDNCNTRSCHVTALTCAPLPADTLLTYCF